MMLQIIVAKVITWNHCFAGLSQNNGPLLQQRDERKRREKMKTQGLYEQHQAKNAGYSKTFREREQER